jgi:hypothetical protein
MEGNFTILFNVISGKPKMTEGFLPMINDKLRMSVFATPVQHIDGCACQANYVRKEKEAMS